MTLCAAPRTLTRSLVLIPESVLAFGASVGRSIEVNEASETPSSQGERRSGGLRSKPEILLRAIGVGFLLFVLSLSVRVTNLRDVFRGGPPQIMPFDELYHAARILYSANNLGAVLNFDPQRGIHGAFCPWPPLYDLSAGAISRLGGPTPVAIFSCAVWIPPVTESLFAALLAFWMALRKGVVGGILTGAAVSISTVVLSRLGDIDHHFLEPPLLFGIIATTILCALAREPAEVVRSGLLLGVAVSVALLVQTALLLGAAASTLAILLLPGDAIRPRWSGAIGFGLAAAITAVYGWSQPPAYPQSPWFLGSPHAAALLGAAIASGVSAIALSRRASAPQAFLVAVVIGGLGAAAIPSMVDNLMGGIGFFAGDPWLRTIDEFQPLFQSRLDVLPGICKLGGGIFLAPLLIRGSRRSPGRFVLLVFGLVYVSAGLSGQRFLICARPLLALLGALAVMERKTSKGLRLARGLLLFVPTLWYDVQVIRGTPPVVNPQSLPFFRLAGVLRSSSAPPQRVLAPWTWGHLIEFQGGQAPVVDGFGSWIGLTDFEDALGAVLLAREDHVADYCRRNGIRFIVLENPMPRLLSQAETIGLSRDFFLREGPGGKSQILPLMRFSFWWRAYFDEGRPVKEPLRSATGFRRFRLAYVDPTSSESLPGFRGPALQVWELTDPLDASPDP